MDRYLEIRLAMAERALQEVGEDVDIIMVTSDDLGMTDRTSDLARDSTVASSSPGRSGPSTSSRRAPRAKRYYHTDGAIYPLLPRSRRDRRARC